MTGYFANGNGGAPYVDGQTISIHGCKAIGCEGAATALAIYIISSSATGTLTFEERWKDICCLSRNELLFSGWYGFGCELVVYQMYI